MIDLYFFFPPRQRRLLTLAPDLGRRLLHVLGGLLGLGGLLLGGRGGRRSRLLRLLGRADGLVPLRLPDLWLLVALGEDVGERGADHGALELLRLLRPLLGSLLLNALAVLPAVEDRPGDLARVPPQEVGLVASPIDELEGLSIGLDESPALARGNLVAAVGAQFDLHPM